MDEVHNKQIMTLPGKFWKVFGLVNIRSNYKTSKNTGMTMTIILLIVRQPIRQIFLHSIASTMMYQYAFAVKFRSHVLLINAPA